MTSAPHADGFASDQLLVLVPQLRRYARALLRDAWLADDLVQDTLERAWQKRARFTAGTDLRAWLFAIMHNLFISQVRRNDPLRSAGPDPVLLDTPAPMGADAVDSLDVVRLVDLLPQDQRAVLLLVAVEQMSYADTALALGVPIGTVMSRLARARERIRTWMESNTAPRRAGATALRIVK